MMQYCEPRNIILTKVSTRNTELLGEWTTKRNTLKTQFWACELFFLFFSIDYYTETLVLFYLLNIETNFELWKVAKPGTLKYEKPICIKTSRNKNKSKSWKQLNNNIILEWQSKWKHTASVKRCFFQGLNCLPCVYIIYLMFITVNLVILWSWSVRCSCSSWCLMTTITEF